MSNPVQLSDVSPAARRRLAVLLLPCATVLLAAGTVVLVRPAGLGWSLAAVALLALGVLLALVAAGLRRSAGDDEAAHAEAELDATLVAAAGTCGGDCGSCGVSDCAVTSLPRTAPQPS